MVQEKLYSLYIVLHNDVEKNSLMGLLPAESHVILWGPKDIPSPAPEHSHKPQQPWASVLKGSTFTGFSNEFL